MPAYRFCRSDDIALLVDALNRCWAPYYPDEPAMTPAAFKRSIRDLQVWCSSCMVAFSGGDPIGVLIGAKRATGTLVHRISVHPDHRRQGHGRHLLDSLASKLAILGPPRIAAEIVDAPGPARDLLSACGYTPAAVLTDYVLPHMANQPPERVTGGQAESDRPGRQFVIPVSVDDLAANGLLDEAHPDVCWERSPEAVMARKDDIAGLAVASDERIEAYLLYMERASAAEIVSLRSLVDDDGERLKYLIAQLRARGLWAIRFPKVHPAEVPADRLASLGFRPADRYRVFAATARSVQADASQSLTGAYSLGALE